MLESHKKSFLLIKVRKQLGPPTQLSQSPGFILIIVQIQIGFFGGFGGLLVFYYSFPVRQKA